MNTSKWLLLGLTLLFPSVGWSQSPSATTTDLQRLQTQREQALAAAAMPINRQYQAALQQLLRTAMQRGDLDGANAVKAAMSELTASAPSAGALASEKPGLGNAAMAKRFAGTRWNSSKIVLTFGVDGKFTSIYKGNTLFEGTWKAASSTELAVKSTDGKAIQVYQWDSGREMLIGENNRTFTPLSPSGAPPTSRTQSVTPANSHPFGKP